MNRRERERPLGERPSTPRLRVAAYTSGLYLPAARFRVRQYIPRLSALGVDLHEFPALLSSYPPHRRILRPLWAIANLGLRIPEVVNSFAYDVTLLEREMVSTFVTLEPFTKRPRVLDVDDAVFLYRGGRVARRLAQACDSVICGNAFLAEQFVRWNRSTVTVPTAVDTLRFRPRPRAAEERPLVIGWSGTSSGLKYLYQIEDALASVLAQMNTAVFHVVSDQSPSFRKIPPQRLSFTKWSPDNEVEEIQRMDVGIMPLPDTDWERGKCSYKMLLYMACGLPVVVSPVGMNIEVLAKGVIGLAAENKRQWTDRLLELLHAPTERRRMGDEGRRVVERHYSIDAVAPVLASHLSKAAK